MSALDKVMLAAGWGSHLEDGNAELVLAARTAVRQLAVMLASDDDGDDDGDGDGSHAGHATYKALVKKNVPPKRAAAMCAKADKKAEMSALADSAQVVLSALFDGGLVALSAPPGESASDRRKEAKQGNALSDGSYPIPDKSHLRKAAILAASKHGNWKAAQSLIRRRARELGVELSSLPGFGGESEKVAASVLAGAEVALARSAGDGGVPMYHPPFTGTHEHSHHLTAAHSHSHQHFNDNNHDGGPQHRTGSVPRHGGFGE